MRQTDPTPGAAAPRAPARATPALAALLAAALLAGCGAAPAPPPAEAEAADATNAAGTGTPPASGEHTALRDAMQAPVDRAEDARAATEAADAERAQALEDAGG